MAPFNLGRFQFPSKKAAQATIQSILRSSQIGQKITGDSHEMLYALLQNHPHAMIKIGCGTSYFQVWPNPEFPNTRSFYVIRTDGSRTDFSYLECFRPTSPRRKFAMACRQLVVDQIATFKRDFFIQTGGQACCEVTGEIIFFTNSHVDHVYPITFERLLNNFILDYGVNLDLVEFEGQTADNSYIDRLADKALADAWIRWHKTYARLRVISARANQLLGSQGSHKKI